VLRSISRMLNRQKLSLDGLVYCRLSESGCDVSLFEKLQEWKKKSPNTNATQIALDAFSFGFLKQENQNSLPLAVISLDSTLAIRQYFTTNTMPKGAREKRTFIRWRSSQLRFGEFKNWDLLNYEVNEYKDQVVISTVLSSPKLQPILKQLAIESSVYRVEDDVSLMLRFSNVIAPSLLGSFRIDVFVFLGEVSIVLSMNNHPMFHITKDVDDDSGGLSEATKDVVRWLSDIEISYTTASIEHRIFYLDNSSQRLDCVSEYPEYCLSDIFGFDVSSCRAMSDVAAHMVLSIVENELALNGGGKGK
jgi:hypothetical protein